MITDHPYKNNCYLFCSSGPYTTIPGKATRLLVQKKNLSDFFCCYIVHFTIIFYSLKHPFHIICILTLFKIPSALNNQELTVTFK